MKRTTGKEMITCLYCVYGADAESDVAADYTGNMPTFSGISVINNEFFRVKVGANLPSSSKNMGATNLLYATCLLC